MKNLIAGLVILLAFTFALSTLIVAVVSLISGTEFDTSIPLFMTGGVLVASIAILLFEWAAGK